MAEMIEKEMFDGNKVKLIGPEYDPGALAGGSSYNWKSNIVGRDHFLKYVSESERYWYAPMDKWFGSEKRKNPA